MIKLVLDQARDRRRLIHAIDRRRLIHAIDRRRLINAIDSCDPVRSSGIELQAQGNDPTVICIMIEA